MSRRNRSTIQAAKRPRGLRRRRRRTNPWPRILVWAAGLALTVAGLLALVTFPAVVLVVCAAVLLAALSWRSRARRADGSGLMPTALVWAALVALILSLGATALRLVIPDGGFQFAAQAPAVRFAPDPSALASTPTTAFSASPSVVRPAAPPSSAKGASPSSTAGPTQAPASASVAPASPVPGNAGPAPTSTAAPPSSSAPAPAPTPSKTCTGSWIGGLLPDKSCG